MIYLKLTEDEFEEILKSLAYYHTPKWNLIEKMESKTLNSKIKALELAYEILDTVKIGD